MVDLDLYNGRCGNCGAQTQVKKYPGVWLGPICSTCASVLVSLAQTESRSETRETDQASQTRVPPKWLDTERANSSPARRPVYIRRHWRGELSLAVSYWVNIFLFGLIVVVVQTSFLEFSPIENPLHAARLVVLSVLPYLLICYPWQVVGVWRACRRRIATRNRTFWAHVVQLVVALGCFFTFLQVVASVPLLSRLCEIAFGRDGNAKYSVSTSDDGTTIHVQGELGIGVSREVANALRNRPGITRIVLDSPGGFVYEGRQLSKLIINHGLETYTLTHCYSACTIAFISGHKRHLGIGAGLGFHEYTSAFDGLDVLTDLERGQARDARLFRRQGVQPAFLSRLFLTPHDDLWYPSTMELRNAGVIHGVVKPSELVSWPYTAAPADLANAALANPMCDVIKTYEPRVFAKMRSEIERLIRNGASPLEIAGFVADNERALAEKYLPQTSDQALVEFTKELVRFLEFAKSKSPLLCVKLLHSDQYERPNLSERLRLSEYDAMPRFKSAMQNVVEDAFAPSHPKPASDDSVTAMGLEIMSRLAGEAKYLHPSNLQTKEDYQKACDVGIRMYELILEQDNAAGVLRYFVSPE